MSRFRTLVAVSWLVSSIAGVSADTPSPTIAANPAAVQSAGGGAPAMRRLTTLAALRQYPGYYHLQNLLLSGEFVESASRMMFRSDEDEMLVMLAGDAKTTTGPVEVRAQLIDVGRLEPGDPRLSGYGGGRETMERWPRPGEELLLHVTGVTPGQPAAKPTFRALALEPWRFDGQTVTLVGQFRGLNILGDLPSAPTKGKFDFVLRGGEASLWVIGLRPRGKGFDLDVNARVDTGRWLQVTGVVKQQRGLVTIEATKLAAALAPSAQPLADEPDEPPVPPARLEVVFSSPTDAEVDVPPTTVVRVQFSRGLDPTSIAGHIRVSYTGPVLPSSGAVPPIEFRTGYDPGARAVEIKFAKPLERFQTVTVDVVDGLKAFDGGLVVPWTLTFSVGQ